MISYAFSKAYLTGEGLHDNDRPSPFGKSDNAGRSLSPEALHHG